jgi:hypothetical protein
VRGCSPLTYLIRNLVSEKFNERLSRKKLTYMGKKSLDGFNFNDYPNNPRMRAPISTERAVRPRRLTTLETPKPTSTTAEDCGFAKQK